MGKDPVEAELDAGAFYYGDHLRKPMVHRVRTNMFSNHRKSIVF